MLRWWKDIRDRARHKQQVHERLWTSLDNHDLFGVRGALLQGAEVDSIRQSNEPETPLIVASRLNLLEIARLLLQHGADPNLFGMNSLSPLIIATIYENEIMVQTLMKHGGNPIQRNRLDRNTFDYLEDIENVFVRERIENLLKSITFLDSSRE